jgi:hypothetical protein
VQQAGRQLASALPRLSSGTRLMWPGSVPEEQCCKTRGRRQEAKSTVHRPRQQSGRPVPDPARRAAWPADVRAVRHGRRRRCAGPAEPVRHGVPRSWLPPNVARRGVGDRRATRAGQRAASRSWSSRVSPRLLPTSFIGRPRFYTTSPIRRLMLPACCGPGRQPSELLADAGSSMVRRPAQGLGRLRSCSSRPFAYRTPAESVEPAVMAAESAGHDHAIVIALSVTTR